MNQTIPARSFGFLSLLGQIFKGLVYRIPLNYWIRSDLPQTNVIACRFNGTIPHINLD